MKGSVIEPLVLPLAIQGIQSPMSFAKKLGVERLNYTMTNPCLEAFLFPEKQAIEKGYFPVDLEKVHKELQKKNVTLA
ncbi:hypothetical protein [Paucisalibacillus globulus]|uniref:hypothetical protein n=1 Tax=Paucisalibacillus globulus TaxID=351095 RepID=UPI001B7FA6F8|nr:hypothetical protein [Paucisalibacillus globulus]